MKRKHPFAKCRMCGEHLYEGDAAYIINDAYLCPDCIRQSEVTLPEPDITPAPDYERLRKHWQTNVVTKLK